MLRELRTSRSPVRHTRTAAVFATLVAAVAFAATGGSARAAGNGLVEPPAWAAEPSLSAALEGAQSLLGPTSFGWGP